MPSGFTGSPPRRRGRPPTCSENRRRSGLTPAQAGTAPRSRRPCPCRGLTPAQAGTALRAIQAASFSRAHPRAGGDGPRAESRRPPARGSPPRRRGRRHPGPPAGPHPGLTPAQAGTATCRSRSCRAWRAHPRAGGDGQATATAATWTRAHPAQAGTAPSCGADGARAGAHPRAGGDGVIKSIPPVPSKGSPPRRRGRLGSADGVDLAGGLTPAQAGTASAPTCGRRCIWAHPRAGGDGVVQLGAVVLDLGSPPRRRGRLQRPRHHRRGGGLTPAQAGTASTCSSASTAARAHPRAGGDGAELAWPHQVVVGLTPAQAGTAHLRNGCALPIRAHPRAGGDGLPQYSDDFAFGGSPPRRRGRRNPQDRGPARPGLTPAQAGTAAPRWGFHQLAGAHPRAGGDGPGTPPEEGESGGSPPRRRGRPLPGGVSISSRGLTPAQAGTASGCLPRSPAWRAHPRAGGDGWTARRERVLSVGSPPRRRGRLAIGGLGREVGGLTPAQAGTAMSEGRQLPAGWAHSRAGGDGPGQLAYNQGNAGSPPRRRGRPPARPWQAPSPRLTPAQAGTAPRTAGRVRSARAHPRAGGDGSRTGHSCLGAEGSPPRRRGRLPDVRVVGWQCGLTPAQAGTASRRWISSSSSWAHPRAGGDG